MKVRRLLPWASAVLAISVVAVAAFSATAAPSKSRATNVRVADTDAGGVQDRLESQRRLHRR